MFYIFKNQKNQIIKNISKTLQYNQKSNSNDGQTKEHAVLARSLGVTHLIVAVNKMDMVEWSRTRFDQIVGTLGPFLKAAGFRDQQVTFVPVSGLTGDNLTVPVATSGVAGATWYHGPTLLDSIDSVEVVEPDVAELHKPFRFVS